MCTSFCFLGLRKHWFVFREGLKSPAPDASVTGTCVSPDPLQYVSYTRYIVYTQILKWVGVGFE